jgi:hypothetical protein
MKKIISITFTAFAAMAMSVTGCKDKPCDVVVCANSGVCVDGTCDCQLGYEGIHCETAMRDKYLGFYGVNENGTLTGSTQYNVNIECKN